MEMKQVNLGYETITHRQGPAVNSHCANYLIAEAGENCEIISSEEITESYYIHNKEKNLVTTTHVEYFARAINPEETAYYKVTGREDFDFSFDNGVIYDEPEYYTI